MGVCLRPFSMIVPPAQLAGNRDSAGCHLTVGRAICRSAEKVRKVSKEPGPVHKEASVLETLDRRNLVSVV